jgi:hypothetical protein
MNIRFRFGRLTGFSALAATLGAALCVTATSVAASTCPFDTGGSDAINDGVVLTRYALNIRGTPMTARTRYASLDPLQVKNNIECIGCALDMNGDNQVDAVDATIIARHLAGFSGASLTNGLALGAGSRSNSAAVVSFLANGCAASTTFNAFVQGGNAFGAPGVIGTNDAQPLTVKTGGTDIKVVNLRGDGSRVTFVNNSPNTINGNNGNSFATGVYGATIGGGGSDVAPGNHQVTGNHGTVAGGRGNKAYDNAVVSGGTSNDASGSLSVVSGGSGNTASANTTVVAGGFRNVASGLSSTVAGGQENIASGFYSFAAGSYAHADKNGAFVWADSSTSAPFKPSLNWSPPYGEDTFNVRATGGVMFATAVNTAGVPTTFCYFAGSLTGWSCTSDRNVKERIEPITPSRVLAGVLAMPVSTWSIIGSKVRQMGPMAQDFYRAFGLGDSDKAINSIDSSGVAFAAIQGLNERLQHVNKTLGAQVRSKDVEIAKLKGRLAAIEKKLGL